MSEFAKILQPAFFIECHARDAWMSHTVGPWRTSQLALRWADWLWRREPLHAGRYVVVCVEAEIIPGNRLICGIVVVPGFRPDNAPDSPEALADPFACVGQPVLSTVQHMLLLTR